MNKYQLEPTESERNVTTEKDKLLKPYSKPYLEDLGDLRSLTLGPSPGMGESGPNWGSLRA